MVCSQDQGTRTPLSELPPFPGSAPQRAPGKAIEAHREGAERHERTSIPPSIWAALIGLTVTAVVGGRLIQSAASR